jgi:hypothetical protein
MTFGNLDNAKNVWDMLAQRYNTTNLAQQFHIVTKLHRMRQEPGKSIIEFYSQMTHLWNLLALCEPEWRDKDEAFDYIAFRDNLHLVEFLTAIRDEFKNTRASLLHRSPLSSLESAFSELVSEETRFSIMKLHTPQRWSWPLHHAIRVHLILFMLDLSCPIGISSATTIRNLAIVTVNAKKGFLVGIIKLLVIRLPLSLILIHQICLILV